MPSVNAIAAPCSIPCEPGSQAVMMLRASPVPTVTFSPVSELYISCEIMGFVLRTSYWSPSRLIFRFRKFVSLIDFSGSEDCFISCSSCPFSSACTPATEIYSISYLFRSAMLSDSCSSENGEATRKIVMPLRILRMNIIRLF
ncbi:hypothetical protein D3C73_879550 [compost metagenome]